MILLNIYPNYNQRYKLIDEASSATDQQTNIKIIAIELIARTKDLIAEIPKLITLKIRFNMKSGSPVDKNA